MQNYRRTMLVLMLSFSAAAVRAVEIDFVEDFALSTNREDAVKQLIPGTEDFYYYQCLNFQNQGKYKEVKDALKSWVGRHGRTRRVEEMENRQALLDYDSNPRASLTYLKTHLDLTFHHEREILGQKPMHPTQLDQELISRKTLTARAMSISSDLGGFEDSALEFLISQNLNEDRRRELLNRLQRPDYSNLVQLVNADLDYRNSSGFGSMKIHHQMLLSQLDELLALRPGLINDFNFASIYITKLRPGPDVDWQRDSRAREEYFDRMWSFVQKLPPAQNSLRAHVLYQRLSHDRALGVYDKSRFMDYIKLPRNSSYINPVFMQKPENRNFQANMQSDFHQVTLLPPVGDDEPLVRDYFMHFFATEGSYDPYAPYVMNTYLKDVFAETKILNNIGDMEKWYSLLNNPEKYQEIKDRIEIEFSPVNKTHFRVDEPVGLDIDVKNVKTLIVKVFEINTMNYYSEKKKEIDTGIDLDGLVAGDEKNYVYDETPMRRVRRHYDFPNLKKSGVYVVELIGNGRSSRALIRKGRLSYLERRGAAGHVCTILDEDNKKVENASIWLAGHEFKADKDGLITIPYSAKPERSQILINASGFTMLDHLDQAAESYTLKAGFYVDRETLLKRAKAKVLVRPAFTLNGVSVSLSLLEDPTLIIESTDLKGVKTSKEVRSFKLAAGEESVCEFQVPENIRGINFTLKGRVQSLSENKKLDLSDSESFSLNGIDSSLVIESLLLSRVPEGYKLRLFGKTGEIKADRPVAMTLKHRDFRHKVNAVVQTDAEGCIKLGALKDIEYFTAVGPGNTMSRWQITPKDRHTVASAISGREGDKISIPYMGGAREVSGEYFSLLEKRGDVFCRDHLKAIAMADGLLEIIGIPAGVYELVLKESKDAITINVAPGIVQHGYVLGTNRLLEVRNPAPLQIRDIVSDDKEVRIQLKNVTESTRVHVTSTRFCPEYDIFPLLGVSAVPVPQVVSVAKLDSVYVSGRAIGDEYRYILERKYAQKLPGNMLARPSLLLNPWALRQTDTDIQDALAGTDNPVVMQGLYGGRTAGGRGAALTRYGGAGEPLMISGNIDFLPVQAAVLTNLKPDKDGVVAVARKDLGEGQEVHVIAINTDNTAYRELVLPETKLVARDLRLANGLDPAKHFTEQKQIAAVAPATNIVLNDIMTSKIETYDTIGRIYRLYCTLSHDATLVEFGFVADWPSLKLQEQREKYSKYACHELNFFLYRKDPKFFQSVVLPALKNKKDKTFMDHWLLGDDMKRYLQPWAYGQLNIVERILLGQRAKEETPAAARHVKDLQDLIPPDLDRLNQLFLTAIQGSALETGGYLASVEEAKDKIDRKSAEFADDFAANAPAGAVMNATTPVALPPPKSEAMRKRSAAHLESADKAIDSLKAVDAEIVEYELQEAKAQDGDVEKRSSIRQLYRKVDKTQEWAENNYYHLPVESQNAALVTANPFWVDYASHDGNGPFLSSHVAEASHSFTEMMLALAILDLPFAAKEPVSTIEAARLTLATASPVVAFSKEIREVAPDKNATPLLVSQNFFRASDRYRFENGERFDKYVTDEFLTHVVYGCQVVLTDPTSAPLKLDVLLQIPHGAIPVNSGFFTQSQPVQIGSYSTTTFEYYFYFPSPGDFPHYPVHVARNGQLVAYAAPVKMKVVNEPSKADTTSWDYVSQNAKPEEVIAFLDTDNPNRLDLERIAWRMKDKGFFEKTLALLSRRHVYSNTLWSYGIFNDVPAAIREFLLHTDGFLSSCGMFIDCTLVTIDPVERKAYQHLEYNPLINARAHQLGKRRQILNTRLAGQYRDFMRVLSYRKALDDADLMSVVYYMLLQDRVDEARSFFARINPKQAAMQMQYDYLQAYLDLYTPEHKVARGIAVKYRDYPVDRWRNVFLDVIAQLDETEGKGAGAVVDKASRDQAQSKLAATEGSFDFSVEARKITVNYQNLTEGRVNYYLMDVELLFSRNPFVQQDTGQFAFVQPNRSDALKLAPGKKVLIFDLPGEFKNSNVMVEIVAGGARKAQPYFANSLGVQMIENYGQIKVTNPKSDAPLAKVYVKVYARMQGGEVKFYKDGYTDQRGRFEYAALSTGELDNVEKFSVLIMSETEGAVIREASPPKQ